MGSGGFGDLVMSRLTLVICTLTEGGVVQPERGLVGGQVDYRVAPAWSWRRPSKLQANLTPRRTPFTHALTGPRSYLGSSARALATQPRFRTAKKRGGVLIFLIAIDPISRSYCAPAWSWGGVSDVSVIAGRRRLPRNMIAWAQREVHHRPARNYYVRL